MECIGILAAIITTYSFFPQVLQVVRTKNTSGISLKMYIILVMGLTLWVIYGISIRNISIIFANGITFIFSVIILYYKILNDLKNKK